VRVNTATSVLQTTPTHSEIFRQYLEDYKQHFQHFVDSVVRHRVNTASCTVYTGVEAAGPGSKCSLLMWQASYLLNKPNYYIDLVDMCNRTPLPPKATAVS
jgi:hypothetical protein